MDLSSSTDLFLDKVDAAVPEVADAVLPLFRADDRDLPDFEGTGVLLAVGHKYFVLSAAHVFDHLKKGVFVLLPEGTQLPLRNPPQVHQAGPEGRKADRLDVGFVSLDQDEAKAIGMSRFLRPRHLSPRDAGAPRAGHLILGFPHRFQKPDYSLKTYKTQLLHYSSVEAPDSAYRHTKLVRHFHLLIRFNANRVEGPKGIGGAPDMHGMSGGGVWRINPLQNYGPDRKPYLVAILTERPDKYKKALLATRIEVVLAAIRHCYPNLEELIPPSPLVIVRVSGNC